jgi:2-polyprenyl-3-methyl-5-hydroxy-6-metoxy-1,4-benzoquinol methylase
MSDILKQQYNSLYQNKKDVFRGGKPVRIVTALLDYLDTGSVVDVGSGEGTNALYLAERGFDVIALDVSDVGLQHLTESAERIGVAAQTQIADISDCTFESTHDLFLFSYMLHHLDENVARAVIEKSKAATNPDGAHVIATFINEGGLYERAKGKGRFYPSVNDLLAVYSDWDIVECYTEAVESLAKNKGGEPFTNTVVNMIALNRSS